MADDAEGQEEDEGEWDQAAFDEEAAWPEPAEIRPWWGWTALVLSMVGFGVSMYLTIDHFTGTLPPCPATSVISCTKVTTSPESEIFGVLPVALLGLLFYTGMVGINLPPLWRARGEWGRRLSWARLAMVVVGIGMVVYLISAELFSIKAICLWCTSVHAVTFVLFVLVVATFPAMSSALRAEDG